MGSDGSWLGSLASQRAARGTPPKSNSEKQSCVRAPNPFMGRCEQLNGVNVAGSNISFVPVEVLRAAIGWRIGSC